MKSSLPKGVESSSNFAPNYELAENDSGSETLKTIEMIGDFRDASKSTIEVPRPNTLKSRFSSLFPKVNLYAPEDTKMLLEATESALARMHQPRLLIDACTGDALVPSQVILNGNVESFVGLDIDSTKAMQFLGNLSEEQSWISQMGTIKSYNLLDSDLYKLSEDLSHHSHEILVAANPPWIPVPEDIDQGSMSQEYRDSFVAINGGESGLKYYALVMELAESVSASRLALNIPSIVNMIEFKELLIKYSLVIDFINGLDTYSYGFDGLPEVQKHYKNIDSCFRYDEENRLRYLLMGMVLRKGERSEIDESFSRMSDLFDKYRSGLQLNNSDFYTSWSLEKEDEIRILSRISSTL